MTILTSLVSLDFIYALTGLVLMVFAALTFADRGNPQRIGAGVFWFTLGLIFAAGQAMPYRFTGLLVLLMVTLDGAGWVRRGSRPEATKQEQVRQADRLRDRIFLPVLSIPLVTFGFAVAFRLLGLDVNRGSLVGLGFGGVVAMAAGLILTGGTATEMMEEGRRLNDAMGAVNVLPQLLASLGVVFTAAKVGDLIAGGIQRAIPDNSLFPLALANCTGMALFALVMGNSFAAFPVIASGLL